MSRRSIGAVLLALALVCAAQALSLAWDYGRVAGAVDVPVMKPSAALESATTLARSASCPEVVVGMLEQSARGDEALQALNRSTTLRLASTLRSGSLMATVLAIMLGTLGIVALRSTHALREAPASPYGSSGRTRADP